MTTKIVNLPHVEAADLPVPAELKIAESEAEASLKRATRQVELARDRLNRLSTQLTRLLEAEDAASIALGDAVDAAVLAGIEGKNQAERDSLLRQATAKEREVLEACRVATRRARAAYDRAQRTYDTARYRHRTWRVIVAKESGVGGEDTW